MQDDRESMPSALVQRAHESLGHPIIGTAERCRERVVRFLVMEDELMLITQWFQGMIAMPRGTRPTLAA
jgi:hypothetical protein